MAGTYSDRAFIPPRLAEARELSTRAIFLRPGESDYALILSSDDYEELAPPVRSAIARNSRSIRPDFPFIQTFTVVMGTAAR